MEQGLGRATILFPLDTRSQVACRRRRRRERDCVKVREFAAFVCVLLCNMSCGDESAALDSDWERKTQGPLDAAATADASGDDNPEDPRRTDRVLTQSTPTSTSLQMEPSSGPLADCTDTSCCPSGVQQVLGTSGNDQLEDATGVVSCVVAFGGDDLLEARNEPGATLVGGAGADYFDLRELATVVGGPGADTVHGRTDAAIVDVGAGDDIVDLGSGDDVAFGGKGSDILEGHVGDDVLVGGDDSDLLDGGTGEDSLFGGTGPDVLDGGSSSDFLDGGWGDDVLDGGADDDTLVGGPGFDSISGGSGSDTILIRDLCEIASGGTVDGGSGTDLLAVGFDPSLLATSGITITSVENIVEDSSLAGTSLCFACACTDDGSGGIECCSGFGLCEGDTDDDVSVCDCDPGRAGSLCGLPTNEELSFAPTALNCPNGTPGCEVLVPSARVIAQQIPEPDLNSICSDFEDFEFDGPLDVVLYVPEDNGVWPSGTYPLAVFVPGQDQEYTAYPDMHAYLAMNRVPVLSANIPTTGIGTLTPEDRVKYQICSARWFYSQYVNTLPMGVDFDGRTAFMGHSQGGESSVIASSFRAQSSNPLDFLYSVDVVASVAPSAVTSVISTLPPSSLPYVSYTVLSGDLDTGVGGSDLFKFVGGEFSDATGGVAARSLGAFTLDDPLPSPLVDAGGNHNRVGGKANCSLTSPCATDADCGSAECSIVGLCRSVECSTSAEGVAVALGHIDAAVLLGLGDTSLRATVLGDDYPEVFTASGLIPRDDARFAYSEGYPFGERRVLDDFNDADDQVSSQGTAITAGPNTFFETSTGSAQLIGDRVTFGRTGFISGADGDGLVFATPGIFSGGFAPSVLSLDIRKVFFSASLTSPTCAQPPPSDVNIVFADSTSTFTARASDYADIGEPPVDYFPIQDVCAIDQVEFPVTPVSVRIPLEELCQAGVKPDELVSVEIQIADSLAVYQIDQLEFSGGLGESPPSCLGGGGGPPNPGCTPGELGCRGGLCLDPTNSAVYSTLANYPGLAAYFQGGLYCQDPNYICRDNGGGEFRCFDCADPADSGFGCPCTGASSGECPTGSTCLGAAELGSDPAQYPGAPEPGACFPSLPAGFCDENCEAQGRVCGSIVAAGTIPTVCVAAECFPPCETSGGSNTVCDRNTGQCIAGCSTDVDCAPGGTCSTWGECLP